MIDESKPVTGCAFVLKQWHKYKGMVTWESHSVYFRHEIFRSRWKDTGRHTTMYGAMHNGVLVLGRSLDEIRKCVKALVMNE